MEVKINARLFFMGLITMLVTALTILFFFRTAYYQQAEENIRQVAQTISIAYDSADGSIALDSYAEADYRVTLIAPTGIVLYESELESTDGMEDHSTREEVVEAIKNGSAQSTRRSSTMGVDTYYAAVRLCDGNILRIAQDTGTMWEIYNKTLPFVVILGFLILLASIFLSFVLTRQLIAPINKMGADPEHIGENVPYPELQPFADSLQAYQLRERQNEKQRKEFTANVSHELKTPLTSISGYAEMIENGMCRPEDVRSFGARIHTEAARLVTLVGDIIRLTQMDEADAPPTLEKTDLARAAAAAAELLELNAQKAGIEVLVRGEPANIQGSVGMLDEMVYNLCDNAIRYGRPGGHVWLTTGVDTERRAWIEVKDDGIGIAPEHQSRVFERFYRVDKSHSKETGGTGLGLAIVKHAAALMGGTITLHSKPGLGTTITVSFPAAAD